MTVGAWLAERQFDPGDDIGVAAPDQPVIAECRTRFEQRLGRDLAAGPGKRGVEIVDVGVEKGKVLASARAEQRSISTVPLGKREVVAVVALVNGWLVGEDGEAFG